MSISELTTRKDTGPSETLDVLGPRIKHLTPCQKPATGTA
jgi:hypothetical protein